MRVTLKASLTALMLTSVAAVPLATAPTFLGADAAYAKSDKAKGGKGGKSGAVQKGKKGKSGDRGGSRRHGGLDGFFDKLTGKGKSKGKGGSKKSTVAAAMMDEPTDCGGEGEGECTPELRQLHPSELGKMNGALNANENAILAHIRNGNMSNGPVGLMAGYAYHSVGTADAREFLDSGTAQEYQAYQEALADAGGSMTMEQYADWVDDQMALPEEERDPEFMDKMMAVETAKSNLGSSNLDDALGKYLTYDQYLAATYNGDGSVIEGAQPDEDLEDAFASLGTYDADTAAAVKSAGEDVQAYDDALAGLYDAWNKGDADSENADDLKAMLDARIGEYTEVEALYDEMNPPQDDPMNGEEMTACDEGVDTCDELAAVE